MPKEIISRNNLLGNLEGESGERQQPELWKARKSTSLVTRIQFGLFGVLSLLLKKRAAKSSWDRLYISQTINLLQLLAFTFSGQNGFAWSPWVHDGIGKVIRGANFALFTQASPQVAKVCFLSAVSMLSLTFMMVGWVAWSFANDSLTRTQLSLLGPLHFVLRCITSILYVPLLVVLLGAFKCNDLLDNSLYTCGSTPHVLVKTLTAVVMVIFVSFTCLSVLTLVPRSPLSVNFTARAHGRVMCLSLILRAGLSVVLTSLSPKLAPLAVIAVVFTSFTLAAAMLYYLPFYEMRMNSLMISVYSIFAWSSVCLVLQQISGPGVQGSEVIFAFLLGLPCVYLSAPLLLSMRLEAIKKLPVESFDTRTSPLIAELALRVKLNLLELKDMAKEARSTAWIRQSQTYRDVADQLGDSPWFSLHLAMLLKEIGNNYVLGTQYVHMAKGKRLQVDEAFNVFIHQLEELKSNQGIDGGTQNFMAFDYNRGEAMRKTMEAMQVTLSMWTEFRSLKQRPRSLIRYGYKLRRIVQKATFHLEELMRLTNSSIPAMQLYATFSKTVLNDNWTASRLAERIEEHRLLESSGDTGEGKTKSLHLRPVATISGSQTTIGKILDVSKKLCSLLGYKRDDLVGKNISSLCPPPFDKIHDMFLKKYLETQTDFVTVTRKVWALHAEGHVVPLSLEVTPGFNEDKEMIFYGVFTIQASSPGNFVAIDNDFKIQFASKQFWLEVLQDSSYGKHDSHQHDFANRLYLLKDSPPNGPDSDSIIPTLDVQGFQQEGQNGEDALVSDPSRRESVTFTNFRQAASSLSSLNATLEKVNALEELEGGAPDKLVIDHKEYEFKADFMKYKIQIRGNDALESFCVISLDPQVVYLDQELRRNKTGFSSKFDNGELSSYQSMDARSMDGKSFDGRSADGRSFASGADSVATSATRRGLARSALNYISGKSFRSKRTMYFRRMSIASFLVCFLMACVEFFARTRFYYGGINSVKQIYESERRAYLLLDISIGLYGISRLSPSSNHTVDLDSFATLRDFLQEEHDTLKEKSTELRQIHKQLSESSSASSPTISSLRTSRNILEEQAGTNHSSMTNLWVGVHSVSMHTAFWLDETKRRGTFDCCDKDLAYAMKHSAKVLLESSRNASMLFEDKAIGSIESVVHLDTINLVISSLVSAIVIIFFISPMVLTVWNTTDEYAAALLSLPFHSVKTLCKSAASRLKTLKDELEDGDDDDDGPMSPAIHSGDPVDRRKSISEARRSQRPGEGSHVPSSKVSPMPTNTNAIGGVSSTEMPKSGRTASVILARYAYAFFYALFVLGLPYLVITLFFVFFSTWEHMLVAQRIESSNQILFASERMVSSHELVYHLLTAFDEQHIAKYQLDRQVYQVLPQEILEKFESYHTFLLDHGERSTTANVSPQYRLMYEDACFDICKAHPELEVSKALQGGLIQGIDLLKVTATNVINRRASLSEEQVANLVFTARSLAVAMGQSALLYLEDFQELVELQTQVSQYALLLVAILLALSTRLSYRMFKAVDDEISNLHFLILLIPKKIVSTAPKLESLERSIMRTEYKYRR